MSFPLSPTRHPSNAPWGYKTIKTMGMEILMDCIESKRIKKVRSSMARSLPVENLWGQLSTTCSNVLKRPNGELLVAVNHNQLRTMVSETVDLIDWSHPPLYTGQYPLSSTYCTEQCGLQITRLATLSEPRTCDFGMPGRCTACAATQG